MDCDFTIGATEPPPTEPDATLVFDVFQDTVGWYDIAGLEYDDESEMHDLFEDHRAGDTTVTAASDGSLESGTGTYGYLIFDDDTLEESSVHGGGKEEYSELVEQCLSKLQTTTMSSTRMEALGLLGLLVAFRYFDPDHLVDFLHLCDSEATINTYRKLHKLNRMQLPKLPNSDVWMMVNEYRKHWCRTGPGVYSITHVPSHMDDLIHKAGGCMEDLTPPDSASGGGD